MGLHREGTTTLLLVSAFCSFSLFALWQWEPLPWMLLVLLSALLLVLLAIVVWFFRVPARTAAEDPRAVIAPADGRVVAIEEVRDPEYFHDVRRQVSIFMSPLNVHINWYPISGEVTYFKYHPGKYLVAWHPKSSTENERSTVVVRGPHGEVLFRQIAGALARRICTYSRAGDPAKQGGEFGFIKFGSRVDMLLPREAEINVRIGEKVTGSRSIIARFP